MIYRIKSRFGPVPARNLHLTLRCSSAKEFLLRPSAGQASLTCGCATSALFVCVFVKSVAR